MFKETEKLQLMDQVSLKQDPLVFLMTGLCVCVCVRQHSKQMHTKYQGMFHQM